MTQKTAPRTKSRLLELLKTAFDAHDEAAVTPIAGELGPHVDRLNLVVKPHGQDGEAIRLTVVDESPSGNGPGTMRAEWPIPTACRIARELGYPDRRTADVVEECLEQLDANAEFKTMARVVAFLTGTPSFGIISTGENIRRAVKTYRLDMVDGTLVEKWVDAAEKHVQLHDRDADFVRPR